MAAAFPLFSIFQMCVISVSKHKAPSREVLITSLPSALMEVKTRLGRGVLSALIAGRAIVLAILAFVHSAGVHPYDDL